MQRNIPAPRQQNFGFGIAGAWFVVMLATAWAYWPGLNGPFLFDDFGSIASLGDYGGVTDWETFKAFVFGGHSGPTGRPLSRLTFLIDGNNWPADAWPFKRTNLVIHLINGTLLGILIAQILRILGFGRPRAHWLALLGAACWMLHPFLVSTTLYVVQRMAQLSTLFIFAGLAGYLLGRVRIRDDRRHGYLVMSLSLVVATVLSMVCKENGILLPLLAGVIEVTILAARDENVGRLNRSWAFLFLVVPSLVIGLYLVRTAVVSDFFSIVPPREFSRYERVLTQPRVLVDYLQHWFIPKLYTTGVFQDHFVKSTGWLAPVTTLLSTLFHASLIGLALARRRKWPLFALAVLFFYGAHLIESTVVNLELYFEHRNYLAAAFLFLPVVALGSRRLDRRVFVGVASCLLLLLGGFTHFAATVWQDYSMIVAASARKSPTSARAQGQYAMDLFNAGRPDEAIEVLDAALENVASNRQSLLVMRLNILCEGGRLSAKEFADKAALLSDRFYDPRLIRGYTSLTDRVVANKCPEVSVSDLRSLFEAMVQAPANRSPATLGYSHLQYFIGYTSVFLGDRSAAITAFEDSLASRRGAGHAMIMAAVLATGGFYEDALRISALALTQLDDDRRSTIGGARVSEADIRRFQEVVRADIAAQQAGDTGRPSQ